jgi:uncharacterized membrane protein
LVFIDFLRGWSVLVMIEAHILNATFDQSLRGTNVFRTLDLLHGFVAPSFLFASGLTFAVTSERKFSHYLALENPLLRQIGRLLSILACGYALHLPYFSFRKIVNEATSEELATLFRADILHCIAVSLLVLLLLVLLLRNEKRLLWAAVGLGSVIVLSTPLAWDLDLSSVVPLPLVSYLNVKTTSVFPLFPWAAFVLIGAVVGFAYNHSRRKRSEAELVKRLVLVGILIIGAGLAADNLPLHVYPHYDFWHTSPSWFAIRLGVVILLFCCFWWLDVNRKYKLRMLSILGRESLLVYVIHILIIYGSVVNPYANLAGFFGASLTLAQCFGLFIPLLLSMYLLAFVWNRIKTDYRVLGKVIMLDLAASFLYLFITREY